MGDSRLFQLGLWDDGGALNADVAFFTEGGTQPNGQSVMRVLKWWDPNADTNSRFAELVGAYRYDWSRIIAVLIDEPYMYNTGGRDTTNPCRDPADPRNDAVRRTAKQLADAAEAFRTVAPSTRFWVNFSSTEIAWARDAECSIDVNQPYIDVLSLDSYWGTFDKVARPQYEWLASHRTNEYQQFALIPGTFFRDGKDNPSTRASYLPGYFEYANAMNSRCDLPLGRVGVTGNWDGCPVWLVMGWLAPNLQLNGKMWRGLLDPLSSEIAAVWNSQLALQKLDPISGRVESYDAASRTFTGWAVNRNAPATAVHIQLWVDDAQATSSNADLPRADTGDRYGSTQSGFAISVPQQFADGRCHKVAIYALTVNGPPNVRRPLNSAVSTDVCVPTN